MVLVQQFQSLGLLLYLQSDFIYEILKTWSLVHLLSSLLFFFYFHTLNFILICPSATILCPVRRQVATCDDHTSPQIMNTWIYVSNFSRFQILAKISIYEKCIIESSLYDSRYCLNQPKLQTVWYEFSTAYDVVNFGFKLKKNI